jgi:simple sugar transport system permease protein
MTATPRPGRRGALTRSLAAVALGLLALVVFLALAGYPVLPSLEALWRGSLGSRYVILSATLVRATPLLLLGLAFAIGARAGGLNIGMEGQFAAGAIAATWVGVSLGGAPSVVALPAVLLAGTIGGALWMLVPVALRLRFGVTEVISTLLLNFVAEAAVSWAVSGPLQEAGASYPQSDPIAVAARLPRLLADGRVHWGLVLALLLAAAMALFFRRHRSGFALKAAGAGPVATALVGRVSVPRLVAVALLASGALAGLGGAVEVSGVSHALYQRLSPGYGFTAIAVALLGRLRPGGVVLAALLFGALEAGAGAMQRDVGVPAVAVQVVQAVVILAMVLGTRERR